MGNIKTQVLPHSVTVQCRTRQDLIGNAETNLQFMLELLQFILQFWVARCHIEGAVVSPDLQWLKEDGGCREQKRPWAWVRGFAD